MLSMMWKDESPSPTSPVAALEFLLHQVGPVCIFMRGLLCFRKASSGVLYASLCVSLGRWCCLMWVRFASLCAGRPEFLWTFSVRRPLRIAVRPHLFANCCRSASDGPSNISVDYLLGRCLLHSVQNIVLLHFMQRRARDMDHAQT